MLIETEFTPNPLTRKYLPGCAVMASGSRDFPNAEAAQASPLAHALFATGDVEGVFFGREFISISAKSSAAWEELEPDVLSILLDHFITDAPLFAPGTANGISVDPTDDGAAMAVAEDPADADIVDQIKELIESRVRPAVAQDGGDIVYRGYAKGTLYLAMQGACSGCPSSAVTLKRGIEGLIKHYVPEVETVKAV